ncbi:response regulator [Aurantimonas sp. A3-2-R12]|uniref:response regulator n=1 Tax=Aurantimonas sp. A3-2-R12 TaxID=3114362 RepID=UPI002E173B40|nr:response regulator [Aurantimonas sp. A3-2-R12]
MRLNKQIICASDRPDSGSFRPIAMSEGEAPPHHEPRVLIVDDEYFVAWHLEALLQDLEFNVCDIAGDCESAVKSAIDFAPDLILMDVNLGGGPDGVETVRRIFQRRQVPVIFITAYTDEANLTRIRQAAPAAEILSKPVSPEVLQAAIGRALPSEGG